MESVIGVNFRCSALKTTLKMIKKGFMFCNSKSYGLLVRRLTLFHTKVTFSCLLLLLTVYIPVALSSNIWRLVSDTQRMAYG
jgi:hypothetical protein